MFLWGLDHIFLSPSRSEDSFSNRRRPRLRASNGKPTWSLYRVPGWKVRRPRSYIKFKGQDQSWAGGRKLGADCFSTLSLVFTVIQPIFFPGVDAKGRWGNPIILKNLGPGLRAEEILAFSDAEALIIDPLWPLSCRKCYRDTVRLKVEDRFNTLCRATHTTVTDWKVYLWNFPPPKKKSKNIYS